MPYHMAQKQNEYDNILLMITYFLRVISLVRSLQSLNNVYESSKFVIVKHLLNNGSNNANLMNL
jgi:hypothetical protein